MSTASNPIAESFRLLKERTRHRYEDWEGYAEFMGGRFGQSTSSALPRFVAELESIGLSRGRVFEELAETWSTSGRLKGYFDDYPDVRKHLPAVFRFESTMALHRELMALREAAGQLFLGNAEGGRSLSVSPERARALRESVDEMGWLSDNLGIYELAREIKSTLDIVIDRDDRDDLKYASQFLEHIVGMPRHLDVRSQVVSSRFIDLLLHRGFDFFAKSLALPEEDALVAWAASDMRRQVIPDLLRSCGEVGEETREALVDALEREWRYHNECLLSQYDERDGCSSPGILEENYRYREGDPRHHAIYRDTWNAYDYIYELEAAASQLARDDPRVRTALWDRFGFLKGVVDEYAASFQLKEPVFTRFGVRTTALSNTPELEELFVVARALQLVEPNRMGRDAFDFLKGAIHSQKFSMQDRGYMLRRIEEFYEMTDRMGKAAYKKFVDAAGYAGVIKCGPSIPKTLDECRSFDQRMMKRWADRDIESQLSSVSDVRVDPAARNRALVRLSQWGGDASRALPVLEQISSALPPESERRADTITMGGQHLFNKPTLNMTASAARQAHGIISAARIR